MYCPDLVHAGNHSTKDPIKKETRRVPQRNNVQDFSQQTHTPIEPSLPHQDNSQSVNVPVSKQQEDTPIHTKARSTNPFETDEEDENLEAKARSTNPFETDDDDKGETLEETSFTNDVRTRSSSFSFNRQTSLRKSIKSLRAPSHPDNASSRLDSEKSGQEGQNREDLYNDRKENPRETELSASRLSKTKGNPVLAEATSQRTPFERQTSVRKSRKSYKAPLPPVLEKIAAHEEQKPNNLNPNEKEEGKKTIPHTAPIAELERLSISTEVPTSIVANTAFQHIHSKSATHTLKPVPKPRSSFASQHSSSLSLNSMPSISSETQVPKQLTSHEGFSQNDSEEILNPAPEPKFTRTNTLRKSRLSQLQRPVVKPPPVPNSPDSTSQDASSTVINHEIQPERPKRQKKKQLEKIT